MRSPFQNLTGLAKSAAILASILVISLGLCGANAFLYARFINYEKASVFGTLLVFTGIGEAIAILVGAAGIAVVSVLALARWIHHRFFSSMK